MKAIQTIIDDAITLMTNAANVTYKHTPDMYYCHMHLNIHLQH